MTFHKVLKKCRWLRGGFLIALAALPLSARAQTWTWTTEQIDIAGSETSLTADQDGNLHLSYYRVDGGQLMYAFRSADAARWFTTSLDRALGEFESQVAVDSQGNPHICYSPRTLKYAHFNGKRWIVQDVDKGTGLASYTCSIKLTANDLPRISWYVENGVFLRYAELKDGVWMARTLDNEGLPGKWNSLALDAQGNPHIAYIDFPQGQLRYTAYDGQGWSRLILDAPGKTLDDVAMRGFGASLVIDAHGDPLIAYYDTESLRLARFVDGQWKKEVVQKLPSFGQWAWKQFRSTLALDSKGNPHIGFESLRGLEHTWWDGRRWRSQLLISPVGITYFDSSMTIDKYDNIYISYKDSGDGTLRLLVGRAAASPEEAVQNGAPKH